MRAVWLDGEGGVRVEDRPAPSPAEGEAVVRVLLAGVCATDLALARGYMGFRGVPGHEFVGICEEAPGAPDLEGARVVGEINAGCGTCERCAQGLERHCAKRTVLGILGRPGAFAERLALPVRNLHRVPDNLPNERAVFCEPVAAAFEILDQVEVDNARTLVLGAGRLGGVCAHVLSGAGARVTVLGHHPKKLRALRSDAIRTALGGPGESTPRDDRGALLPRQAFDVVVEATGSPRSLADALHWVRPRGTIVLKTTCAEPHRLDLAPAVIHEITIVGSRCGRFAPALEALAAGRLTPEDTIDAALPLERAADAFRLAAEPALRKVILEVA